MPVTHRIWVAFGAVCVLACVMGYLEIFSPDVGNHLASGRFMVEHRAWPGNDPLTYTRSDRPYVDLLWGWHVLLWLLYRSGGTLPMVLTGIALTLASFGLVVLRSWRSDPRLLPLLPPLLLLFCLGNLWELRPHIASWILLNLVLLALEEASRGDRRALWALPPLMLVWVNTHSLFVLGLVAIGAYALANLRDRRLRVFAALSVLACLVNPWGLAGLLFPLEQLKELQGSSPFKAAVTGIAEFRSPFRLANFLPDGNLVLLQPLLFIHVYAAVASIGAIAAVVKRRIALAEVLVFALFAYVLSSAQKNFGYFALATFPLVARGLALLVPRVRFRPAALLGGFLATCALVLCLVLNGFFFTQERVPHRFGHAFNRQMLPVRACAFLRERVPAGRILNTLGDGGYVEFATGLPVFIDGRNEVVGPEFFAAYQRMQDLEGFAAALRRWDPQIVLVPFNQTPAWFFHLNEAKEGWRCVYQDEQDAVFLRSGFAPEVPAIGPARAGIDYPVYPPQRIDAILAEARRGRGFRPLGLLTGPHDHPLDAMQWATLFLLRGEPEAAVGHGLAALERATVPVPDLWHNLAVAFLNLGDRARAALCYEAVPAARRDPRLGEALRQNASARHRGTTSLAASQ